MTRIQLVMEIKGTFLTAHCTSVSPARKNYSIIGDKNSIGDGYQNTLYGFQQEIKGKICTK